MAPTDERARQIAWLLAALLLPLILHLHLLPALLAGLLVYQLVHMLAPLLGSNLSDNRARLAAVVLLSVLVIAAITATAMLGLAFLRSEAGSFQELANKLAAIVEQARAALPAWLVAALPAGTEAIHDALLHWLREHSADLQLVGKGMARGLAHVLLGMVIGAMVALRETYPDTDHRPLAAALLERARKLSAAFHRIVFAQVRISAINTFLTALYLVLVLPLCGIHLPLTKTLVALTFVAGLLPVVGNLISNTAIVVVSLSHSPELGLASLVFLVVIHKLEYFLNAHIIGSRIAARAWELLLAMLLLEAAFGIPGLIAAPIYYAYLKDELSTAGWI
ncbi:hypothetical protein B9N43_01420 [Denitratisoma sp. DHT3]|uniref:AI-2E family transporter n=1 Tax=Denitratisoma sp. DHT3 TaxID=1981880 RepID=UPI0011985A2A|nr:AI-2E family transporter [Denitratisoma sp. DHT3]QDX80029.1 hypothetical protein B9N43_01420 [Denitratisoma sp. DHT3]